MQNFYTWIDSLSWPAFSLVYMIGMFGAYCVLVLIDKTFSGMVKK